MACNSMKNRGLIISVNQMRESFLYQVMTFTIEPMVNMGKPDVWEDEDDGWTIRTEDGKPSAQWEYTILVTEDGTEILSH